MIRHTPETMTLSRYSKFEKAKDLRLLFRYNVPKWYALKYSGQFVEEFNRLFNENTESQNDNLLMKLMYQNKIMLMQVLLTAVQMHLGEKIQLNILKYGNDIQYDDKLQYYFDEIFECTGIKIEKTEDILAFRAETERKIDKYNELFPEKVVQKAGVSILQLAFSIFSLLNMPANLEMTLSEFAELKKLADDRAKKMQELADKNKRNG